MNTSSILFDPLLPWPVLLVLGALALGLALFGAWRGLAGWWLRGLAAIALTAAIANPSLQQENRQPLSDIVLAVVDDSASQGLSDRDAQTEAALNALEAEMAGRGDVELRVARVGDGPGNTGTLVGTALTELLAEEPRDRIAGAIVISDGQIHDADRMPDLPAPLHLLQTGRTGDWDRRLIVQNAPAFAILDEEITLKLRIEDDGAVPADIRGQANIAIAIDGEDVGTYPVPVGEDLQLPLTLSHGGINVIQFQLDVVDGELTDRNNAAIIQINGVRDRLRVLLVSGEPHPGERTWRNLLKSDSSVDLVHFTILRPPEKQDGVPVTELSLIAFPTRELFLEKIDEFDLIIFDRYKRRGILPGLYLDNVRQYVEDGGAVLIAAGPDFATAASLYRSPLGAIIPAAPSSARVLEEGYRPKITDLGQRHPVTEGLDQIAPWQADEDGPGWGRWFRLVDVEASSGNTVMSGTGARPLLQLDRVGEGRIALMATDHAWLWDRGYEGGGPQLELLRRLAHWMMREPELEEERLIASGDGLTVTITRRTLGDETAPVTITGPDGTVVAQTLEPVAPGQFQTTWTAPEIGLYRLQQGDETAVVALGPAAPKEFEATIATDSLLKDAIAVGRGGALRIEDGVPGLRDVRPGRVAAGRGWIGITPRDAYRTADVTVTPMLPAWLWLFVAAGLVIGAWLIEGRRDRPAATPS